MPLKVSLPSIKGSSFRDWRLQGAILIGIATSVISIILVVWFFLQQFLLAPSVVNISYYSFHFGILLLALTVLVLWMLLVLRHCFRPALHGTEMHPSLPEGQPRLLTAPRPTNELKPDEGKKEQSKRGEILAKQFGNVFCISLANDIEDEDNEDSFDLDSDRRRYAVTDGVATSFIPAPWAKIVAEAFVRYPSDFHDGEQFDEQAFRLWLAQCSQEWQS